MRLLNTTTYELKIFPDVGAAPPYAILSHCWDKDEITFSDIQDLAQARAKPGWKKVESACAVAFQAGYDWLWMDTCCIDKSSSAELSEAINSMFNWYKSAQQCLAYLGDVHSGDPRPANSLFRRSRWFTRGWTLQELVAPGQRMIFLSASWKPIGSRPELADILETITQVSKAVLDGERPWSKIAQLSVAQRMAWAAGRKTTRAEDRAYSLMGIFDVNMPILYGEGAERAFRRLQLEIIRQAHDHTIFAWGPRTATLSITSMGTVGTLEQEQTRSIGIWPTGRLLASSPDEFHAAADIQRVKLEELTGALCIPRIQEPHFYDTHFGIRIRLPLCHLFSSPYGRVCCAALACQTSSSDGGADPRWIGLILSQPKDREVYFCVRNPDPPKAPSPNDAGTQPLSRVVNLRIPRGTRWFLQRSRWHVETIYIYTKSLGEEEDAPNPQ